jgi:hypothetical protein
MMDKAVIAYWRLGIDETLQQPVVTTTGRTSRTALNTNNLVSNMQPHHLLAKASFTHEKSI